MCNCGNKKRGNNAKKFGEARQERARRLGYSPAKKIRRTKDN